MKASAVASTKRKPLRVVRLEPDDFATSWKNRPERAIAVGLRLISDAEENVARAAAVEAVEHPAVATAEYNDALVSGIVAAAICDPNDAQRDPDALPCPRDMIRRYLTAKAIGRLYHDIDALVAEASPASRAATDEELDELADLIDGGNVTPRARRLLAAALDELTE